MTAIWKATVLIANILYVYDITQNGSLNGNVIARIQNFQSANSKNPNSFFLSRFFPNQDKSIAILSNKVYQRLNCKSEVMFISI